MKVLSSQLRTLAFSQVALQETIPTTKLHRNMSAQGRAQRIVGNHTANFPAELITDSFKPHSPEATMRLIQGDADPNHPSLFAGTEACRSQIAS